MALTRDEQTADWIERVVGGFERLAAHFGAPDLAPVARAAHLEEVLKDFVSTMQNPQSSDQEWQDLLADAKEALGV